MGAMPEEIEPILKKVQNYTTIEYAGNKYYEATYSGIELVIAYSKIGKVFSTLTAATMIEHFNATKLLFSGVAGAISNDLKVGDLIVATKLAQHDLDITAFGHPFGYVPEGAVFVEADKELIALSKEVAKDMGKTLKEGVIATGDQFVANEEKKEWIQKTFGADAIEMEGVSVAYVCQLYKKPCFILRAISDAADMDANFDFDSFLFKSAQNSAEFIVDMVDEGARYKLF